MSEFDPINKPKHYCEGRKYEPIDVILDWDLNFCLGQVVKYVSRAGRKGDILSDINKALYYLERAKTEIIGKLFEERLSEQKKESTQEPDICKTCAHLDRDAEGKYWCTNTENADILQMDGFPTECKYYYNGEEPSNSIPHRCCNCKYGSRPDKEVICTCPSRISGVSIPYLYFEENDCRFWEAR